MNRTAEKASAESPELQLQLRDVTILSLLATGWKDADRQQLARGLADVLMKILIPDFVYVRLQPTRNESAVEVSCAAEGERTFERSWAVSAALEPFLRNLGEVGEFVLADPRGGSFQAVGAPIGHDSEFGAVVAGSRRPGFPELAERLLLGVAANQAAVDLQRLWAGEARAALGAIVESSEDAIVSKTLDGIITSWNASAERLFGYSSAEAVGRSILFIIPADKRAEEDDILARLRRGERIRHFETVRRAKDGRLIDVSIAVSPIRDGSGRIVGASKVARDVSERKRAEEAVRRASRSKDEFLAVLGHELRNPLAPLRNAAQVLRAKCPPVPELQWVTEVIDRQVHQITRLADDLLDVSRVARGKIQLRKERVELSRVVNLALETSGPMIDKWGHQLVVDLPGGPLLLEVDPDRIAQALSNLLNNAAKFTRPGGSIRLTAERHPAGVRIRVQDSGVGIDPEMLPHIFEMYSQIELTVDRSLGGLGIGLPLVKRLVEVHGGTVEASSAGPGQGSEFVLFLPAATVASTGRDNEQETPQAGQDQPRRCNILIVDDHRDSAESLAMLLCMMGHEVRTAFDGQAALEAAAAQQPEVMLLDIGLPKLNGYEVARRIRQSRGEDVMLIALTGWGQKEDRRRSREAGFDHHVTKPVEPEALLRLLPRAGEGETPASPY